VNELTLVLANHISDKVIDDVIEGLGKSYKVTQGAVIFTTWRGSNVPKNKL
jgi:hypothetical protein